MAQEYAESFYNSKEWIKCRQGFMSSKNYVCEKCSGTATICHHIEHISPGNIHDPLITLNWDNLMSLCHECHQRIHGNTMTTREGLIFDEEGNIVPRIL